MAQFFEITINQKTTKKLLYVVARYLLLFVFIEISVLLAAIKKVSENFCVMCKINEIQISKIIIGNIKDFDK